MKPILLEFAGLNSYREPQTVNFAQLMSGGLFGIFGPTGSGKSTILDAITLALYGTVDRAEHNTQGILNQAEQRLWVKFSFALSSGPDEIKFRVERSFKRGDENAVHASHCRLVSLADVGEEVLADKPSDVTAKVQEILGLRVDDFTRAVVLPQGKFAKFLHEKPADRRLMLQRLFDLSQYGDKLQARLKAELGSVDMKLKRVEGEQAGLGDASEATVAAAATRLEAATGEAQAASVAAVAAEEGAKQGERVWALQQELGQIEQGLAAWQAMEPEAERQRAELAAAQRAEQVRAPLTEKAAAALALENAESQLATRASAHTEAQAAAVQGAEAHKTARVRRESAMPGLLEQQGRLKQALTLADEIKGLAEQVADLAGRVAKGRQLTERTQAEMADLSAQAVDLQERQAAVMAELAAATVSPERQQQVQQTLLALTRFREAEANLKQRDDRVAARRDDIRAAAGAREKADAAAGAAAGAVTAHEAELKALQSDPPVQEDDLRAEEGWLARAAEAVRSVGALEGEASAAEAGASEASDAARQKAELAAAAATKEGSAQTALEEARTRLAAAKAALEAEHRRDMAGALARGLTPGEPCPVCGSPHHPQPATPEAEAAIAAVQAELKAAEAALTEAERAVADATRAAADARGLAQAASSRADALQQAALQAADRLGAARQALPEAWRTVPAAQLPDRLGKEREENERRQRQYQEWKSQVEAALRNQADLVRGAGVCAATASSAAATLAAAAKALADAEADRAAADAALKERAQVLDEVRGEMEIAELPAEKQRIDEAVRLSAALQKQVQQLAAQRKQLDQDQREKQAQTQKYADLLREREQQYGAAAEQLKVRENQLADLAGGQPPRPQLERVTAELASLEGAEAEARTAAESAAGRLSQAEANLAAARREQELAVNRVARAEAGLAQALLVAGFAGSAEAESALRAPERRSTLDAWLKEHDREGDRLAGRQASLAADLAGRRLDEADWTACQARLAAAKANLESARDERTRAEQAHADLVAKQARWAELEQERRELATRQNHLADLQNLLRGNAFVEFLAEGQLQQVAQAASERLAQLTRNRYALEIDSGGGFIIRDDANGGIRRPVSSLSGGETFLTSLALALTLSAQIQLRGKHPLEFFFLDEGFGTLDPELLNLVIDTLERLHFEKLHVGIISHVPELRQRLLRRLIVEPAEAGGVGSRLRLEMA